MYYFVTAADGGRYGPADIDTLIQWVEEGRIVADTILVERGTEQQVRAGSIVAIAAALRRVAGEEAAVSVERDAPIAADPVRPGQEPPRGGAAAGLPQTPGRHPRDRAAGDMSRARPGVVGSRSRIAAGLLGIFLGGFGAHRFYLGYTGIGFLMLFLSVFGGVLLLRICVPGAGCGIVWLWGLIEGVICLLGGMRDADGLELRR